MIAPCPWPHVTEPRRVRLLTVLTPLLLATVALLGWAVRDGGVLAESDRQLVFDLNGWVTDAGALVQGLKAITLLGDPITLYAVVGLGIGVLWRPGRTRPCLFVVLTALSAGLANSILKALVDRSRPVLDDPLTSAFGQSFPSGHAMGATVTFGAILIAARPLLAPSTRRWAIAAAVVLAAGIGASRVLLGVHHLADVLAGNLVALAWLSGALAISSRGRADTGAEQSAPVRGSD